MIIALFYIGMFILCLIEKHPPWDRWSGRAAKALGAPEYEDTAMSAKKNAYRR